MAVDWEDLVVPEGELDIALLFPADVDDGEARLTGYIAAGVARTSELDTPDPAITLWAQYRAYLQKYQTGLAEASSGGLDDAGDYALLWSQIEAWKKLADERLASFQALIDAAIADSSDALGGWSVIRSLRHA